MGKFWFSGILLFFFLMAIAFMGYVLPFGQMSFWGATVITNLLSFSIIVSIFTFFFFGEIRNLTTFCLLNINGFSLSKSYFFLLVLTFLWIGAQFPQEKFLSYARILTLYYYFLLMCIFLAKRKKKKKKKKYSLDTTA